jgi:Na+-driven multidrug efflux pump
MGATALLCLLRRPLLGLFTQDADIIALASTVIFSNFILEAGRSRNLILVSSLRAAGDVRFPLYIGLISMWVFRVLLSYPLALDGFELFGISYSGFGLGVMGVWIAMTLDWLFRGIIFAVRFIRGTWLEKYKPARQK